MKPEERIPGLLDDLDRTLTTAAEIAGRGRTAFESDPALPLACEALSTRVGEIVKKLSAVDPHRFSDPTWSRAARHRDFVVHHYNRIDNGLLWETVVDAFPLLHALVKQERGL